MDLQFKGLLFDLDGTLIDSSVVIDRAWTSFANKHKLNTDTVLRVIQGKPAFESIKALRPGASHDDLTDDSMWLEQMESQDTEGVVALPGAIELLNGLNSANIPWAIVTSGTLPVATARIKASGLPTPEVLVTPELVSRGKPDPEPYQLGAEKLGLQAQDCIVFEDAVAGVESGVAAGAKVIGVLTQFDKSELQQAKAIECVASLASVGLVLNSKEYTLSLS